RKVKHKPKQAVASNESAPSQEQEDNQKLIKRLKPLLTPAPRPSPSPHVGRIRDFPPPGRLR
ncbi:MAG TPA: hypothetical protein VEI57_17520, partial [Nitrospirota bacterium]|nr:hypothetical protein [Nitrospirota bacterium]